MAPGRVDRGARAAAPAGREAMTTFDEACAMLETASTGTFRQDIVAELANAKDFRTALLRLRDSMRSNAWKAAGHQISLGRIIKTFDSRTRDDGFHVLHDWDGGDADAHLDRLNQLLRELQGSNGSGQRFVDNAETLILIATSHFELHDRGYEKLLDRTRTLNDAHRTNIALGHASSIGSHLRFGFEATYARDTIVMRNDNVADYPWLCFALWTLMREYARMQEERVTGHGRDPLAEAMLNGLTPDARAFVGEPP